jgi:L-lactate permease
LQLSIPHRVIYDFDGQASVSEVAKSIIAQDKLLRDTLAVLEEVFPKLAFDKPVISVREIAQQSPLRTILFTTVVAVYGQELGQDVPDILDALFGMMCQTTTIASFLSSSCWLQSTG